MAPTWLWRVPAPQAPMLCVRTTSLTVIFFHERTWTPEPPQPGAYMIAKMEGGLVFLVTSIEEHRMVCASSFYNGREDCAVVRLQPVERCSFCHLGHAVRCDVVGCNLRVCARCTSLSPGPHPDDLLLRVCPHHVARHEAHQELNFYAPAPRIC